MKKIIIILAIIAHCLNGSAQVKSRISTRTGTVNQLETFGRVTYQGINYYPAGKDSLLVKNDVNKADTVVIPSVLTIDKRPYSVVGFKESAFEGDVDLKHIIIPSSITDIASSAFYGCSRMVNCEMSGVTFIDDYAFSRSGLIRLILPEGAKRIGAFAFRECADLRYVELPDGLESIGESAFASCEIDTIKINFLKPIKMASPAFGIRSSQFKQRYTVLSVPAGSKELFQNDEGWKHFRIIIEH